MTQPFYVSPEQLMKDRADFARYNLLATPGLVINEKLVSAGRIPNQVEVMAWVANALAVA